jgi:hypothetical protein
MNLDAATPNLDVLDLASVARILQQVHPQYTLCECARLAAAFAPAEGCTCSMCPPGTYPGCMSTGRASRGVAAA